MNLGLSEEHNIIRQAARDFARTHLLPGVIERDELQKFPEEQVKKLGELGFMGLMVSPDYGGAGLDTVSYVLAIEEIAKIDASTAVIMSVNNSLVCSVVESYGDDLQKKEYLTPLARGEKLGGFCLSEPEAGSDATSQKTSAIDKGDYFLLNGTKNWITNAQTADLFIVIAQSDYELGHKGINAFVVERKWNGVEVGPKENKLGIRGSDTNSVMFNDVKVPKKNMLGKNGEGFKIAMKTLSGGRIGIAAQALGIASGAYDLALNYSKERKAFGKPISNHQAVAFKLSDMITGIEAGRLLCLKAAWNKDNNLSYDIESAMAKVFCSELSMKVASEAIQIHGGYGYVKEYHVERMLRDAKITEIYEGTSEIQRIVISRGVIKKS